jgi:serine/threonine-protein kinase
MPVASSQPTAGSDAIALFRAPAPGQVLFDRFELHSQIGRGGMGSVWLVRHLLFDELYALKLIIPAASFDDNARRRFRNEARAMA